MIDCGNCEQPFNPEASRWLCPRCGWKNSCCEGESVTTTVSSALINPGREADGVFTAPGVAASRCQLDTDLAPPTAAK